MAIPSPFGVRLVARTKSTANTNDPAIGRPLPDGVSCRDAHQHGRPWPVAGQRFHLITMGSILVDAR
ncbi:hypothetical protein FXF46_02165 [Gluconobacter thailandicus]|uniref:Uncharacterized protein n=1 Tax=Gluconobacter thailandicus TaxID=257438 RepID=A0AAP9EQR3_GLUTH|nr:hypothetical protein FXF46_02165 [Gluconobacter thailandicus]